MGRGWELHAGGGEAGMCAQVCDLGPCSGHGLCFWVGVVQGIISNSCHCHGVSVRRCQETRCSREAQVGLEGEQPQTLLLTSGCWGALTESPEAQTVPLPSPKWQVHPRSCRSVPPQGSHSAARSL